MEQNNHIESTTGVRTSYLAFPNCQQNVEHFEIPITALVTPCKKLDNVQRMDYLPVLCKQCQGVLNPYSVVSYQHKTWGCNFCGAVNQFPSVYKQNLAPGNVPLEMLKENQVIEYVVRSR
jgi:predicted nucleic-acid-binding Zn-ribbon protein